MIKLMRYTHKKFKANIKSRVLYQELKLELKFWKSFIEWLNVMNMLG